MGHNARMQPTVGRIVHYHLTAAQAKSLTIDTSDPWERQSKDEPMPYGEGDVVAAIVARVSPAGALVSLKLIPDVDRVTRVIRHVGEGDLPGEWEWPPEGIAPSDNTRIRLPAALHRQLKAAAAQRGISIAALAAAAIEAYLGTHHR